MRDDVAMAAAEVFQRQLDMPCPPAGWELVQALEARGLTIEWVRHPLPDSTLSESIFDLPESPSRGPRDA